MKTWILVATVLGGLGLSGCSGPIDLVLTSSHDVPTSTSFSAVEFSYPIAQGLPGNTIPQLHLPLRLGVAFFASGSPGSSATLDAEHREILMARIRAYCVALGALLALVLSAIGFAWLWMRVRSLADLVPEPAAAAAGARHVLPSDTPRQATTTSANCVTQCEICGYAQCPPPCPSHRLEGR